MQTISELLLRMSYSPITLAMVVLGIIAWFLFVVFWRYRTLTGWMTSQIAAFLYAAGAGMYVFWYVFSIHLRWIPFALFSAAAAISFYRLKRRGIPFRKKLKPHILVSTSIGVAILASVDHLLIQGYFTPASSVDLAPPFLNGNYVVAHGGNCSWINYHIAADPYVAHAMDIMKLDAFGRRAKGLLPPELTDYNIYHEEVVSPCNGTVIRVINDIDDSQVFGSNPQHPGGNQVAISSDSIAVWLVHLAKGSITVKVGESVRTGEYVGRVGNSGNSSEPHLHFCVQRYDHGNFGVGLPITINGKYLVRNSVFAADR